MTELVKKIGEALLKDCPDNDCIIFRNMYLESSKIREDLKGCLLSTYSVHILESKCRKLDCDMMRMTYDNYAVVNFKRQMKKG